MKTLLFLICTCLALIAAPCYAQEKEKSPEEQKSPVLAALQMIAEGTTMHERTAPNVSFHLGPTKTFITISF
ncbi:MAG: hypothetical protein JXA24_06700 [Proteobacteria bacterium]|nr:hypothetical protein [Pseudomonadota bacterium]